MADSKKAEEQPQQQDTHKSTEQSHEQLPTHPTTEHANKAHKKEHHFFKDHFVRKPDIDNENNASLSLEPHHPRWKS